MVADKEDLKRARLDDFNWFVDNYMDLYERYGHKFLAIRDKKVLGAFNTAKDAIDEISKTIPRGNFIVQECNGKETGYTNFIASWFAV